MINIIIFIIIIIFCIAAPARQGKDLLLEEALLLCEDVSRIHILRCGVWRTQLGPETLRLLRQTRQDPFFLGVEEESSVATAVEMLCDPDQEILIEFELRRELSQDLIHTVQELEEDRCTLIIVIPRRTVTVPFPELVSETQPFLLDQSRKPTSSPEKGIDE